MKTLLKTYYKLTKPGIIYGNLLTAIGGFLLASQGHINFALLAWTAAGTALIIASACVFNNYIDRDIDALMARTRKRALAAAEIEEEYALIYGSVLGTLGLIILASATNTITVILGLIGFFVYVFAYTYAKRKTVYATLIGTIPGATPIASGYTAVTGSFDLGALILFGIMVIWQLPHFYAISIFRKEDYSKASIPVLSIIKGNAFTKQCIVFGIICFTFAAAALALYGYASFTYFVVMLLAGLYWSYVALRGLKKGLDDITWARKIFGHSLIILLIFSSVLAVDAWLV